MHEWVTNRKWDLIVTMDDTTNEHYLMFFVAEESIASSFRGAQEVIEKKSGDSTGHCSTAKIFCDGDKKLNVFLVLTLVIVPEPPALAGGCLFDRSRSSNANAACLLLII